MPLKIIKIYISAIKHTFPIKTQVIKVPISLTYFTRFYGPKWFSLISNILYLNFKSQKTSVYDNPVNET